MMKRTLAILLLAAICLWTMAAMADASVTVYTGSGKVTARGVDCGAPAAIHGYAGPSTSYAFIGIWDGSDTAFRALTLAYDAGNHPWVLTEVSQGGKSQAYVYVRLNELALSDTGALTVEERNLHNLMEMQCVGNGTAFTCRVGPGKGYAAAPVQTDDPEGTILATCNGWALVELYAGGGNAPARVWIQTDALSW